MRQTLAEDQPVDNSPQSDWDLLTMEEQTQLNQVIQERRLQGQAQASTHLDSLSQAYQEEMQ